jgi:hypothetical protein
MISRLLGSLVLTGGIMFGAIGLACAQSSSRPVPVSPRAVPELDPTALGGGIMILAGGLLVLNERRRKSE